MSRVAYVFLGVVSVFLIGQAFPPGGADPLVVGKGIASADGGSFQGDVSVSGSLTLGGALVGAGLSAGSGTGAFNGFTSSDGGAVTGHLTINSGLNWLYDAGMYPYVQGTVRRSISKMHIDRSAWTDNDGDQTIVIGSVPAGTAVVGANAVIRTGYWCSGANPTVSNFYVGTAASPAEFLQTFTAKSAAGTVIGDANAEAGSCCTNTTVPTYGKVQSYTADTNIVLRLTTSGCNVNALTDGGIDLYFVTEQYAQ
ncbi:MAG: hypothetical protein ABT940_10865 [Alphaproteobacteria bacterium]